MNEVWKEIPGYEGRYRVSDMGKIIGPSGKTLKPRIHVRGHERVALYKSSIQKFYFVHRLVMLAFVGPCPDKMVTMHLDGVPTNNKLSNLRYGTQSCNEAFQVDHGTIGKAIGSRNKMSKLDIYKVGRIKEYLAVGISISSLSKEFKVSRSAIQNIDRGITWKTTYLDAHV